MARNGMETAKEVGQSAATTFVGLMVAGGSATALPIVSAIPEGVHVALGYAIAIVGVVGIFESFMKRR